MDKSLIERERAYWTLRATFPIYRRRVAALRETLAAIDPARAYVSFSAGKDSAVLAHAAHQVHGAALPICMVDPGCPTHWTEAERTAWIAYAKVHGWDLHLFHWDKWPAVQGAATTEAHREAAHRAMFADLSEWARAQGRTEVLMGLRSSESKGRRLSLSTHGERYTDRAGRTRHCPLGRWTTDDIWTYIIDVGLPWLSIYDALGPEARNGLIGRNGLEHGRMAYLKRYFPEAYRHARDVLGLQWVT